MNFSIFAIGKYRKSKEQKKFTPDIELEYFRELPRGNATPAQAISIIKELKAEFESKGVKTLIMQADVTDKEAIEELVKKAIEEFGSIDVEPVPECVQHDINIMNDDSMWE